MQNAIVSKCTAYFDVSTLCCHLGSAFHPTRLARECQEATDRKFPFTSQLFLSLSLKIEPDFIWCSGMVLGR